MAKKDGDKNAKGSLFADKDKRDAAEDTKPKVPAGGTEDPPKTVLAINPPASGAKHADGGATSKSAGLFLRKFGRFKRKTK